MERRESERRIVDVTVYVPVPGCAAICCNASDISHAGVFLRANPLHFPRASRLDLVFAINNDASNVVRIHKVAAMVVRSEAEGVGMVFCRNDRGSRFETSSIGFR